MNFDKSRSHQAKTHRNFDKVRSVATAVNLLKQEWRRILMDMI